jgi:STE24 endopeptidase
LLSDALLDSLTPHEIAAVFGHEIGHIAHRHLPYFGFFFLGSLGLLAVLGELVARCGPWFEQLARLTPWTPSIVSEVVQGSALLALLGLYFWIVFGRLSRRFERQADVFGSKVVSCDLPDCPPHHDQDHDLASAPIHGKEPVLCPVGIRIFADALTNVARGNGLDPAGRSWRHGSIAQRIAFLEGLERRPDRLDHFQRGVWRLRIGLGVVLVTAIVLSFVTQLGFGG